MGLIKAVAITAIAVVAAKKGGEFVKPHTAGVLKSYNDLVVDAALITAATMAIRKFV